MSSPPPTAGADGAAEAGPPLPLPLGEPPLPRGAAGGGLQGAGVGGALRPSPGAACPSPSACVSRA